MRKIIVLFLIFACLAALYGCKEKFKPVDQDIKVMTFNVRTIGYEDSSEKFWDNRKELVKDTILKYSPDLIGFQELKISQYDFMKSNLTEYGYYGENCMGEGDAATALGGYNAIFFKTDRFEFVDSRTLWLSETPNEVSVGWDAKVNDYRTLTEIKIKDKLNKKTVTFINTHFMFNAPVAVEESSRMLKNIAEENGGGVIMTGDFNYQEGTPNYNIVISGNLADTRQLTEDTDSGGTFHGFNGTLDSPWPVPIDFIFVTDTFFDAVSYRIIRDKSPEGYYPSDHYPVLSVIKYI